MSTQCDDDEVKEIERIYYLHKIYLCELNISGEMMGLTPVHVYVLNCM